MFGGIHDLSLCTCAGAGGDDDTDVGSGAGAVEVAGSPSAGPFVDGATGGGRGLDDDESIVDCGEAENLGTGGGESEVALGRGKAA